MPPRFAYYRTRYLKPKRTETFEVFRVDAIETVHRVGTEVAIHGAGEEYSEFAQDLGIVLYVCFGEAVEIIGIAWMAPVDHGFDLPTEPFFGFEQEKLTGRCYGQRRSGQNSGRQRARAHQEVDLDLNAVGFSGVVRVVEIAFAQGMFVHSVLQFVGNHGHTDSSITRN
jgi:hypothetical protein